MTTTTRPRIVVLCGSTRFKQHHEAINAAETLAGHVVLACGVYAHSDRPISANQKTTLDALHLHKIDLADEVVIVSPDGYLGASTIREIGYALDTGTPIRIGYTLSGHDCGDHAMVNGAENADDGWGDWCFLCTWCGAHWHLVDSWCEPPADATWWRGEP